MRFLYASFLFFVAFPYTQILPLESYNQPYALLLGGGIMTLRYKSALLAMPRRDCWALAGLAGLGILIFLATCFPYTDGQELKYLLNYLTPFVLTGAVFAVMRAAPNLARSVLTTSVVVWIGVAVVQTLVDPNFMAWTVGSMSEVAEDVVSSGRGVLGLAPEPTHHGFHMLLLGGALALMVRSRWVPLLCIASAILLARSSSALLALALGGLTLALLRPSLKMVTAILVGIVAFVAFGVTALISFGQTWLLEDSRIFTLASAFLESPTDILIIDYSVNMRAGGMLATFSNAVSTFFMPNGMSHAHWLASREIFISRYDWLLDMSEVGPPSGFGVILFQAGFLAVPLLAVPVCRVLKLPVSGVAALLVFSCLFVFLGQFYISSPGFSLLYGCAIYKAVEGRRRRICAHAEEKTALPERDPYAIT